MVWTDCSMAWVALIAMAPVAIGMMANAAVPVGILTIAVTAHAVVQGTVMLSHYVKR